MRDGPGLGSRLTFTIPAVEEARTGPARLSGRSRRSERRRPRILCVDDDPQTLRYVRDALSRAGYTPVVTADPEEVPRLMEEEPRLVLLDLVLPGVDGIALMREIREIADVPVVFLSVYGQDEVVARAFDMGAADYVVKPFSTTELAARIRAALRRRTVPELVEPSEPYLLGDLSIDYAENRVSVRRASGGAHGHRVPDAGRTFGRRGPGADQRPAAATGSGAWTRRAAPGRYATS